MIWQVSDARNEFVVVHNGIITNHKALKDFLVRICTSDWPLQVLPAPRCPPVRSQAWLTSMPWSVGSQVTKGEVFVSETDTEVIPKLCKWIYHSLPERVPFSEVCVLSTASVKGVIGTFAQHLGGQLSFGNGHIRFVRQAPTACVRKPKTLRM